jgi:membrane protein DedA with SNARE-associated domain
MHAVLGFVLRHGYAVLLAVVFAEQVGLPVPAAPYLLAVGALCATGVLSFKMALWVGVLASLAADLVWYELGRRKGLSILRLLCRISIEPDSCVRSTELLFERHGAWSLLYAKFIPGLGTVAPPLAGALQFPPLRFAALDSLGAFLWMGAYTGLGFIFAGQLERIADYARHLGVGLSVTVLAIALWVAFKVRQRRRFIERLRVARVSPQELKAMLDRGDAVAIIDLRHALNADADRVRLPGAIHIPPEQLDQRRHEIPRDRELVLYCT